jgi:hypothetical protein
MKLTASFLRLVVALVVCINAAAAFKLPSASTKGLAQRTKALADVRTKGLKHMVAAKEMVTRTVGKYEPQGSQGRRAAIIAVNYTAAQKEQACTSFFAGFEVTIPSFHVLQLLNLPFQFAEKQKRLSSISVDRLLRMYVSAEPLFHRRKRQQCCRLP